MEDAAAHAAAIDPEQLAGLEEILGPKGVRRPDDLVGLDPGLDGENLEAGVMLLPADSAEAARAVAYLSDRGIAMVPHGGRTGLAGGGASRPGQVILQTSRMDRILAIDPVGGTALVEAGVILERLEAEVAKQGLSVGVDFAARGTATVGGMVSTNAGGNEAFRNGITRHRVLGLEVVLPDGRLLSDLKLVTKANEGYDVKQLFIGAEGTLGLITKVSLSLMPAEGQRATALVSCRTAGDAVRVYRHFRNHPAGRLLFCEAMWPDYAHLVAGALHLGDLFAFEEERSALFVLVEVAGGADPTLGERFLETALGELFEAEQVGNAVIAKNREEAERMWRVREDSFVVEQVSPDGFWHDVSVPLTGLQDYTEALFARIARVHPDLRVFLFGHLGDGNLHLTVSAGRPMPALKEAVAEAVYRGLVEIGGSFSAEHGIGREKRASLARLVSPEKQQLMRAIKQAIDPRGLMNPGKIL